jgi:hypothetical protein
MSVIKRDPEDITRKAHLSTPDLYRGLYSRVARRVGVDRSLVSRVAKGQKTSKRVEKALRREIARVDRATRKLSGRAA